MPSGGGHTAAVRVPSGTSIGVRGERVIGQRLGVGVTRLLSCPEAIGMAPLSRQCGDGGPIATSTWQMAHEEELGGSRDGRACRQPGRAGCQRAPILGISAVQRCTWQELLSTACAGVVVGAAWNTGWCSDAQQPDGTAQPTIGGL
jgi:hypothetical protein